MFFFFLRLIVPLVYQGYKILIIFKEMMRRRKLLQNEKKLLNPVNNLKVFVFFFFTRKNRNNNFLCLMKMISVKSDPISLLFMRIAARKFY